MQVVKCYVSNQKLSNPPLTMIPTPEVHIASNAIFKHAIETILRQLSCKVDKIRKGSNRLPIKSQDCLLGDKWYRS